VLKLKEVERNFFTKLDAVEKRKDKEIFEIKDRYTKEQGLKKDVFERLESLRMELKMLEKNEGSLSDVWKQKCKELVDICNKLRTENDFLKDRLGFIEQN
jgi:hypothetical protein